MPAGRIDQRTRWQGLAGLNCYIDGQAASASGWRSRDMSEAHVGLSEACWLTFRKYYQTTEAAPHDFEYFLKSGAMLSCKQASVVGAKSVHSV